MKRTRDRLAIAAALVLIGALELPGRTAPEGAPGEPAGAGEAVKAVQGYRHGQDRKALLALERLVTAASAACASPEGGSASGKLAASIAAALPGATPDARDFLLKQLSVIGAGEQVSAIAFFVCDERSSFLARLALERIPGPAAAAALRGALEKVTGTMRIGVVNSLGNLRDRESAGALETLLAGDDEEMAGAAAAALGKIGGGRALKALCGTLERAIGSRRGRIADACLLSAEGLLGDPALAEDAARAAVEAAGAIKGPRRAEVIGAMQRVLAVAKDAETIRRADAILREAAGAVSQTAGTAAATTAGASPSALGPPALAWRRTETSIALANHNRTVWQLNWAKGPGKPCFHPVALADGTVLTWLSPPDHPWHRGLWLAWKELNGVNYWEEDPVTGLSQGTTEVTAVRVTPADDRSARIEMELSYRPPGKPEVLAEKRTLEVSAPDGAGRYRIDWRSAFTAGAEDVHLKGGTAGGGYAGLSVRIAGGTREWRLFDSEGREDVPAGGVTMNTHGQNARWTDFSLADTATGRAGGIAVLDHPSNLRFPSRWHVVMDDKIPFGYFSPAPLWSEPYTLPAGKELVLEYRVLVHPGRLERSEIEAEWRAWNAIRRPGNEVTPR